MLAMRKREATDSLDFSRALKLAPEASFRDMRLEESFLSRFSKKKVDKKVPYTYIQQYVVYHLS
jgi:hypothetical protein